MTGNCAANETAHQDKAFELHGKQLDSGHSPEWLTNEIVSLESHIGEGWYPVRFFDELNICYDCSRLSGIVPAFRLAMICGRWLAQSAE